MQQNAVLISAQTSEKTSTSHVIQDGSMTLEEQDEPATQPQTETLFLNEITSQRSENSKQYMMSDKSVTVVLYDEPIHYEDKNGNLLEIDNSLIKTEDGYTNGANTYDVFFSDLDAERGKVDFTENGYGISWQLLEPKNAPDSDKTETADDKQPADYGIHAAYAKTVEEEAQSMEETAKETNSDEEGTDAGETAATEDTAPKMTEAAAADSEINNITDYKDEKEYGYAAKQSSVLFDGFANDVSIEYIPQSDGIKENIIMNTKAPDCVHTFRFR